MSGADLRAWRVRGGMSQATAAVMFGVTERSLRGWEKAEVVPVWVEELVKRLEGPGAEVPEEPEGRSGSKAEETSGSMVPVLEASIIQEGMRHDIGVLRAEVEAMRRRVEGLEGWKREFELEAVKTVAERMGGSIGEGIEAEMERVRLKAIGQSGNPRMGAPALKRKVDEYSQETGHAVEDESQEWRKPRRGWRVE